MRDEKMHRFSVPLLLPYSLPTPSSLIPHPSSLPSYSVGACITVSAWAIARCAAS